MHVYACCGKLSSKIYPTISQGKIMTDSINAMITFLKSYYDSKEEADRELNKIEIRLEDRIVEVNQI